MRKLLVFGMALAAGMVLAGPRAQAVDIVDHFKAGSFTITVDDSTAYASIDQVGAVLGGTVMGDHRFTELTRLVAPGGTNAQGQVFFNATQHKLNYSNGSGFQSVLSIWYGDLPDLSGGGGNDMSSLLDSPLGDLTLGGNNNDLALAYLFSDLGAVTTIGLVDTSGNQWSISKTTGGGAHYLVYKLSDYDNGLNGSGTVGGIDVTDVAYMKVTFAGNPTDPAANDHTIDAIELGFIPEPLTMVGMAMAVGGLARYTRKRRSK